MNMQTPFTILFCLALATVSAVQDAPTQTFAGERYDEAAKKMIDHLVDQQNAAGRANYAAACINVTRAVKRKAVTIFAVIPTAKTGSFRESDLDIEVIFSRDLSEADSKAAGAYYQHSNSVVLSYAAFEYASGNKKLGLQLMRRVVDAHPTLEWSSPNHPIVTVKAIVSGLEKGDGSMAKYLKEDSNWWASRVKEFGR